jgi:hypothetical protein
MMFHFMSSGQDADKRRPLRVMLIVLFASLLAGGILTILLTREVSLDSDMLVIFGAIIVSIAMLPAGLLLSGRQNADQTTQKQKRAAEGMDMYSLIDRMVSELDEDELTYLRRKLENQPESQQNFSTSINELLNQRTERRLRE